MNYKRRGLRRRINQSQLVRILQQKFKDDFFARVSERLANEESPEIESISTFGLPPLDEVPECYTSRIFSYGGVYSHGYVDQFAKLTTGEYVVTPGILKNPYSAYTLSALTELLNKAIEDELYERAALIRDELKRRSDD